MFPANAKHALCLLALVSFATRPARGDAFAPTLAPVCAFHHAEGGDANEAFGNFNDDADAAEGDCAARSSQRAGVCRLTVAPDDPMIHQNDDGTFSVGQTLCCECGAEPEDEVAPDDDSAPSKKAISL